MRHSLLLLLIIFTAGCGNVRHTTGRWGEFETCKLFNPDVQIEIVPAIGRIVSYGPVDGPNLLWTDPAAREHAISDWANYGGDRIWLWPQGVWKARTGNPWPPPTEKLQWTWKVDAGTFTMTSSPVPGWDVRIVRHIIIGRYGSEVRITTTLEPTGNSPPPDICLWQITQIPVPDRLTAVARASTLRQMDPDKTPWTTIKPEGAQLVFTRPPNDGVKVGFDAHQISAQFNRAWFIDRLFHTEGTYRPGERAQIFSIPDHDKTLPDGMPPYIELGYTAPVGNGRYAPLIVQWEVR